jgi:ankyrin repeat protein
VAIKSDYDFFKLCEEGSLQQITEAIENGANVNARSIYGETPLMAAAASNLNPEVITSLVKAGADVNAKENRGFTSLMWAAWKNPNPEVIITLLENGADPKEKNNYGRIALSYARENEQLNNSEALKKLEEVSR